MPLIGAVSPRAIHFSANAVSMPLWETTNSNVRRAVRCWGFMKPGENYWSVLDPIWDFIDIGSPDEFARTFAEVPRNVGLLYAAHFCQPEVNNGGFTQFFWNSTGVLAPEAAEGFAAIEQPGVAAVVRRAMRMLGISFPRVRADRWLALKALSGEAEEVHDPPELGGYRNVAVFGPLEEEFYTLLGDEAGGFESAANVYATRISG